MNIQTRGQGWLDVYGTVSRIVHYMVLSVLSYVIIKGAEHN